LTFYHRPARDFDAQYLNSNEFFISVLDGFLHPFGLNRFEWLALSIQALVPQQRV
jgi:hypothetical protein